jgi:hypothetical protein
MHTHTCTHTCTHTHAHTCTHTCTHACTRTHAHTCTHTHTHAHTCTHTCTHTPHCSRLVLFFVALVLGHVLGGRSTTWATPSALFCLENFPDRLSNCLPGWLWTVILLISASQVASITGVSHRGTRHSESPQSQLSCVTSLFGSTNLWISSHHNVFKCTY